MRLVFVTLQLLCLSGVLHAQEISRRKVSGKPLVTHISTFDAAAHVFGERLYVYVSHDTDARQSMRHYHLLRLDSASGPAQDLGTMLHPGAIRWAPNGLGAPEAAEQEGRYFLYFAARDKTGALRIGVACSDSPEGPFRAEPEPVYGGPGADPAVFRDDYGRQLLYYTAQPEQASDAALNKPASDEPMSQLVVARLGPDMKSLAEQPLQVVINDSNGAALPPGDGMRRFAEGAWVHKYQERYYLTYSTGNSHRLVYATSRNPYGPFTYRGVLLPPVAGWTTRASIVSFRGRWYLLYHECSLGGGAANFRSVKMAEIWHDAQGRMGVMGHGS